MDLNERILKLIDENEQYIIDCRRKIHTYAEVAMKEVKTHAFILEEIKKLGLPYEEVPTTSIIAKLETGRPGKTVALRADIDALPLHENPENLAGPVPAAPRILPPATAVVTMPTAPCCWAP